MSAASKNWTRTALAMAMAGLVSLMSGGLLLAVGGTATAGPGPVPCVASEAWTETIVVSPAVPAIPEVPGTPAVTETIHHEAVAGIWSNFSPNKNQGTFEGPPAWPTDERGTWQHSDKPIPPGHEGPDGVYQLGNGNGSWFYRQAAVDAYDEIVVITPAVDPIPGTPGVPAVTQTVEHPAVVCETTTQPPTTETTTQPPTTETTTQPPTTQPTTQVPEVEPTTATPTPSPEGEETASPESESPESESPEVLGVQESQPPTPQAQVPTAVDAGYAGQPDNDPWGAALVVGGLALLVASGTAVVQARKA